MDPFVFGRGLELGHGAVKLVEVRYNGQPATIEASLAEPQRDLRWRRNRVSCCLEFMREPSSLLFCNRLRSLERTHPTCTGGRASWRHLCGRRAPFSRMMSELERTPCIARSMAFCSSWGIGLFPHPLHCFLTVA